jgi:hypothetical protein
LSVLATVQRINMSLPRVGAPLCAAAITLLAAGCASSHFSSRPPARAAIAGDWKLDWASSDRLSVVLARLATESQRAAREQRRFQGQQASSGEVPEEGPEEGGRVHRRRQQPSGSAEPSQEFGSQDVGGPGPSSKAKQEFLASVPAGDYLKLVASATSFTVVAGDSTNQYSPGIESVIESSSGEATQISGWRGGAYVIDTKPQLGPELIQRFEIAKNGKLAMTIQMRGKGADVTFTRLYDRTTRLAPLAPPTNN